MSKVYIFFADGLEEIEGLTVVDMMRRAGIDISIVSITELSQLPDPIRSPLAPMCSWKILMRILQICLYSPAAFRERPIWPRTCFYPIF